MFILHDFQQMFNLKRQYVIHGSVSILIFIVFISLQYCVITDSQRQCLVPFQVCGCRVMSLESTLFILFVKLILNHYVYKQT